jgi:hypothetical protein
LQSKEEDLNNDTDFAMNQAIDGLFGKKQTTKQEKEGKPIDNKELN